MKLDRWGTKPGFILTNNTEFIQIYEDEINKVEIKNINP